MMHCWAVDPQTRHSAGLLSSERECRHCSTVRPRLLSSQRSYKTPAQTCTHLPASSALRAVHLDTSSAAQIHLEKSSLHSMLTRVSHLSSTPVTTEFVKTHWALMRRLLSLGLVLGSEAEEDGVSLGSSPFGREQSSLPHLCAEEHLAGELGPYPSATTQKGEGGAAQNLKRSMKC